MGEVSDGEGRTFSLLGDILVLVIFADAEVLSESLSFLNLNDGDVVPLGEAGHQLDVFGLTAVLGEDHKLSLELLIGVLDGLADLVESLSQQRVRVGGLDDSLQSSVEIGHLGFSHCHWCKIILYLINLYIH